ncbi:hypothetical protein [Flavobacterium sp.]|jgi:hypothetical protein|uniref:hypothetical protein n=1 Tax=Flavobacterium sp. TaxID=239 RepID=UPI0037C08157
MIKELLRISALVFLVVIIIADDFPFYEKIKTSETQLFLAILVLVSVYFDPIFGLILGVTLLIIYYEIYKKIIIQQQLENDEEKIKEEQIHRCDRPLEMEYITEAHLLAAQNNIFDVKNYNSEIKWMENSMGVQGIGNIGQNAYDADEKYFLY